MPSLSDILNAQSSDNSYLQSLINARHQSNPMSQQEAGLEAPMFSPLDLIGVGLPSMAGKVASKVLPMAATASRDTLGALLHNPPQSLINADIGLNRVLGGGNQTISATIGQNRGDNYLAGKAADALDYLDPGHIQNALANVMKAQPVVPRTVDDLMGNTRGVINPPADGSLVHLNPEMQAIIDAREAMRNAPHQGYTDGGDQIKQMMINAIHSPSAQLGTASAIGGGLMASPAIADGQTLPRMKDHLRMILNK